MHVLTGNRFFSWIYCQKLSKIRIFNLRGHFQKPLSCSTKPKSELDFAMLTELPGEAFESLSSYALSWLGGLAKVLFSEITVFYLILLFAINYYKLTSPANCLEYVSSKKPQHSLSNLVMSDMRKEFFNQDTREEFSRNHNFLGRFSFVSIIVFPYLTA